MNDLSSLSVLIILIAAIIFSFFYLQARQQAKSYKRRKRKYSALNDNLLKLKENIVVETDRWPIYARPILFTDVDHDAQIEFAKAQQALFDADGIVPLIETIPEPETPDQFSVGNLVDIRKNLKTIFSGIQFTEYVNTFEQNILNLRSSLKLLRASRKEVEKKRLDVENSIEELRKRGERINRRLKPLDVRRTIEDHDLLWIVGTAERCLSEAGNSIENLSDNYQGYLEHARADIFVNIGNICLDCIELFLESQKISRRYELDKFKKLFSESTSFLQSILEMDDVWNSWKRLKKIKPYVDALPSTREEAEKSLRSFKHRQQHLEKLITLANQINIQKEMKAIEDLEKECTDYWYSPVERKTYWEKALGSPLKLPSKELSGLQSLLVTEINPTTDVDITIKQSQLLGLIKKISRALDWHNEVNTLTLQLETELNLHKAAHKSVSRLLSNQGEATLVVRELPPILEDTSPDLADRGEILVSDYKVYVDKEKKIQGADFPELLISINHFIAESRRLVQEHYSQLKQLEADYISLYQYIDSVKHDLELFMNHIPKFDKDSLRLFRDAFEESNNFLSDEKIVRYSWLRPTVTEMQTWCEKTDTFISPARDKYNAFEILRTRAEELLLQTQEVTEADRVIDETWNWSKNDLLPRIKAATRAYNRKKQDWDRIINRNWAEYNITRAISQCENIIQFSEGKILELNQAFERVQDRQNELDHRVQEIYLLLGENLNQLPIQDQQEINRLVKIAKQAANFSSADKILNYAYSLAIKRANPRIRREIQKIIINSEGGPVFVDEVINKGTISGATRITTSIKQKGRKRNEKKR